MPDSTRIAQAIIQKLKADAELMALLPNGIWRKVAPKGAKRFAIVALMDGRDVQQLERRSFEDDLYMVEARVLSAPTIPEGDVYAAAARIDALLEDGDLDVPGYALMTMHREEPIEDTEVDDVDVSIQWHRAGGLYRVQVSVGYVAPEDPAFDTGTFG